MAVGREQVKIGLGPHAVADVGRVRDREAEPTARYVALRLEELLRRSDVEPVRGRLHRVEPARRLEHAREGLALDRHVEPGRDRVHELGLEHVGPRVDPVGRRLPGRRLLDERDDFAVGARRHDAEGGRVADLGQRDRRGRITRRVERHERVEVEVGEHVPVAHEHPLVDALGREPDAAGGAERLVLDDEAELDVPQAVVREVLLEGLGQVAERQHDLVDAVRAEPRQLPFEERDVGDREQRLRGREGQGAEAGALPPDEDDRLHGVVVAVLPVPAGTVVELSIGGEVVVLPPDGAVDAVTGCPPRSSMLVSASSAFGGFGSFSPFGSRYSATMSPFFGW